MQEPTLVCNQSHEFCKKCIQFWQQHSDTCPSCRCQMLEAPLLVRSTQNLIMGLKVCCPAKENHVPNKSLDDCGWQGPLSTLLETHKGNECMLRPVVCPVEGCNETMLARDLERHVASACEKYMEEMITKEIKKNLGERNMTVLNEQLLSLAITDNDTPIDQRDAINDAVKTSISMHVKPVLDDSNINSHEAQCIESDSESDC